MSYIAPNTGPEHHVSCGEEGEVERHTLATVPMGAAEEHAHDNYVDMNTTMTFDKSGRTRFLTCFKI